VSGERAPIVLPPSNAPLVEAARAVLATPGLPAVALVGGLAITARVSAAGAIHRATRDIDLVTEYRAPDPEVVELVAAAQGAAGDHLAVDGITVDIIPTASVDDADLHGQEDPHRLFLAGHRWAFETAADEQLAVPDGTPLAVRVATPAGLVAAKCHAVGYPSSVRRMTKHGSDLLDVFRLVDLYGDGDTLAAALRAGPADLARIIADVCAREILANPVRAAHTIALAALTPIDADEVTDLFREFVDDLRR
jgi:hypothetical protein